MEYRVEFCEGYFVGTTLGCAVAEVFSDLLDEMLENTEWRPGMAWIHDHTELDTGDLTVNDVQTIADICAQRRVQLGSGKCAIIVGRDLEFGLARMWGAFVEDRWDMSANVFRSLDDALAWLSV